jgi:hypothetical protein
MSRRDQRTAAPGRTVASLAWRRSGGHLPVLTRPAQSLLLISLRPSVIRYSTTCNSGNSG